MESESFRYGMVAAIARDVFGKKHQTVPVFTNDEIERSGFHRVNEPIFSSGQKSFCCAIRKVIPWTPIEDCNVTLVTTKSQILAAIKKVGFTHLFEVMAHYADFSFDLKSCKKAVCVMVKGATVSAPPV